MRQCHFIPRPVFILINFHFRLIDIKRPIMRIPHLAIHLQREMNDRFSINKETHMVPVIATLAEHELNKTPGEIIIIICMYIIVVLLRFRLNSRSSRHLNL